MPQELGTPLHDGASPPPPATEAAKVERILVNWVEPQSGQGVPCQSLERTKTSFS